MTGVVVEEEVVRTLQGLSTRPLAEPAEVLVDVTQPDGVEPRVEVPPEGVRERGPASVGEGVLRQVEQALVAPHGVHGIREHVGNLQHGPTNAVLEGAWPDVEDAGVELCDPADREVGLAGLQQGQRILAEEQQVSLLLHDEDQLRSRPDPRHRPSNRPPRTIDLALRIGLPQGPREPDQGLAALGRAGLTQRHPDVAGSEVEEARPEGLQLGGTPRRTDVDDEPDLAQRGEVVVHLPHGPTDERHDAAVGPGAVRDLEPLDLGPVVRDHDDRTRTPTAPQVRGQASVDVGHRERTGPARAHPPSMARDSGRLRTRLLRRSRGGGVVTMPHMPPPRPRLRSAGRAAFGRLPGGARSRILKAVGERAGIPGAEAGLVSVVVVVEPGDRLEECLGSVRGQSHGQLETLVCPVGPAPAALPDDPRFRGRPAAESWVEAANQGSRRPSATT